MTTVEPPLIINQATFYLTLLITIGSAAAIIAQVVRGINDRIKRNREAIEERSNRQHEATKRYVDEKLRDIREEFMAGANILREHQSFNDHNIKEIKERANFLYQKLVQEWFDDERYKRHEKSK